VTVDPFKIGVQEQGLMVIPPPANGVNPGGFPANPTLQPGGISGQQPAFGGQQPAFGQGLGAGLGAGLGQGAAQNHMPGPPQMGGMPNMGFGGNGIAIGGSMGGVNPPINGQLPQNMAGLHGGFGGQVNQPEQLAQQFAAHQQRQAAFQYQQHQHDAQRVIAQQQYIQQQQQQLAQQQAQFAQQQAAFGQHAQGQGQHALLAQQAEQLFGPGLAPLDHRRHTQPLPFGFQNMAGQQQRRSVQTGPSPDLPRNYPSADLFQRPYSYFTGFQEGQLGYPAMTSDLSLLVNEFQSGGQSITEQSVMKLFGPLSPYQLEAIRSGFRQMTENDLALTVDNMLASRSTYSARIRFGIIGLVLGPCLYDLWLLKYLGDNQEILCDIFISRDQEDLVYLSLQYQKLYHSDMWRDMLSLSSNQDLQLALSMVADHNRDDPRTPVFPAQVYEDVDTIRRMLNNSHATAKVFYDIFLCRNDTHLIQVANHFQNMTGKPLDEAFRRNSFLRKYIKKVCIHAIRSAVNPTYRDVNLIRDALGSNSNLGIGSPEKLAIRVCRMHWYAQHWLQVKAEYYGITGLSLKDRLTSSGDPAFSQLMAAMV